MDVTGTCETIIIRDKFCKSGYRIINSSEVKPDDLILDEIPKPKAKGEKQGADKGDEHSEDSEE